MLLCHVRPLATDDTRGKGGRWRLLQAIVEHACALAEWARLRLAVAQDQHAARPRYLRCGLTLAEASPALGRLQRQWRLPRPASAKIISKKYAFMKSHD